MKFGIIGITGDQGDGKTAFATKIAIEEFELNPNRIIIANYQITGIKMLTISFHDIVTMLDQNTLPEFVYDADGNEVNFVELYKKVYKAVPTNVNDIFKDSLLIFDELHIAADAYDFLGASARVLSTFITQIRKRGIIFIGVTQHLNQVAKRIRNHFQYTIDMQRTDIAGISYYELFGGRLGDDFLKSAYVDLNPFFKRYDSSQLIIYKP